MMCVEDIENIFTLCWSGVVNLVVKSRLIF